MLLIDYQSIIEEDSPDYVEKATWKLLHAYIDAHSQILFHKYTGDGVQAIQRLKSKCANMTSFDQIR